MQIGRPYAMEIEPNSISLAWIKQSPTLPECKTHVYMKVNKESAFELVKKNVSVPYVKISGLLDDTDYRFQIRVQHEQTIKEGPLSDVIKTKKSTAATLFKDATHIRENIYQLNVREDISARNEGARTRKLYLGTSLVDIETLMMYWIR